VADSDLTLPSTVAAELGVSALTVRIPRLVSAASAAVRAFLRRPVLHYSAAYSEAVASVGMNRLLLSLTPIISIASVTLDGGTVVTATDYSVEDADAGFLYRLGGWPLTGIVRPGLLYSELQPGQERKAITVVYAGGWVTPAQAAGSSWAGPARSLPFDVEEATVQTAVALYHRGGTDQGVASESLGDYSVSYRGPNSLIGVAGVPDGAAALLEPYVRRAA
jgi:hypothetical protein